MFGDGRRRLAPGRIPRPGYDGWVCSAAVGGRLLQLFAPCASSASPVPGRFRRLGQYRDFRTRPGEAVTSGGFGARLRVSPLRGPRAPDRALLEAERLEKPAAASLDASSWAGVRAAASHHTSAALPGVPPLSFGRSAVPPQVSVAAPVARSLPLPPATPMAATRASAAPTARPPSRPERPARPSGPTPREVLFHCARFVSCRLLSGPNLACSPASGHI